MTTTPEQFKRECEARTVNERARFDPMRAYRYNYNTHSYMFTVAQNLIDLIGYCSDSTFDEFQNELACVVSVDDMEEIASCGYANERFSDPTDAEYRSFATECDEYTAIRNHLTAEELTLLDNILTNVANSVDDGNTDAIRHEFNVLATFIDVKRRPE